MVVAWVTQHHYLQNCYYYDHYYYYHHDSSDRNLHHRQCDYLSLYRSTVDHDDDCHSAVDGVEHSTMMTMMVLTESGIESPRVEEESPFGHHCHQSHWMMRQTEEMMQSSCGADDEQVNHSDCYGCCCCCCLNK